MSGVNEAQMQHRIQTIIEDWTLTDAQRSQLEMIKHRIGQQHPGQDVTMTDIDRIVTQPTNDVSWTRGFSRAEMEEILFA